MGMQEVNRGELLFGDHEDGIYKVLSLLPHGLMLDVGAAAGHMTKLMLENSADSRIVAFEPFPGNIPHFRKSIGDDPRVSLVQKAVSDHDGRAKFVTGSVVKGTEDGWSSMAGYSSLGFLQQPRTNASTRSIDVDTCRVDTEVSGHVRFMKVDVQGGELGVIRGAQGLLDKQDIDILFVEFNGEVEIPRFLAERNYHFYDSEYLFVPRLGTSPPYPNWRTFREIKLSIGRPAYRAWPLKAPTQLDEYCAFIATEAKKHVDIYTDMICVSSSFHSTFVGAAMKRFSSGS
jgi:FkbM family methyltransferase